MLVSFVFTRSLMHTYTDTQGLLSGLKGSSVSLICRIVRPHKWKPDFILTQVYSFQNLTTVCQSKSQRELTCQRGQRQCGLSCTNTYTHTPHTHVHMRTSPRAMELTFFLECHWYLRDNNMPLSWRHLIALVIHFLTNVHWDIPLFTAVWVKVVEIWSFRVKKW